MSHFTVMVVTDEKPTEEILKKALQPYHEYECTGIKDEYVRFVQAKETPEDLQQEHTSHLQKYPDSTPESLDVFITEWYGYEKKDGQWGRMTNPDSKWDWWQVGGRWTGFYELKEGAKGEVGEPSLVSMMVNGVPDRGYRVDQARKCDIDFEKMISEKAKEAKKLFERAENVMAGRKFQTWEEVRNSIPDINEARKFYHEQEAIKDLKKEFDSPFFNCDEFIQTKEEYVYNEGIAKISSFAVLIDGKWLEKGEMGWWASVSNENKSWAADYQKILDNVKPEQWLSIVDCHI